MVNNNDQTRLSKRWLIKWRAVVEAWPKIKTPLQLIISQVIGWAIRRWLD
jgi:hypothetical protein